MVDNTYMLLTPLLFALAVDTIGRRQDFITDEGIINGHSDTEL
jgi:hypothetical protein